MKIQDTVYGTIEIDDPLLVRLIKSKPVQRLKGVMQGGATALINDREKVTRFEHSAGVMTLLRMHEAPLEEQAAGLLHDTGHAAFSHVVDAVFKQYNHNYDDAHLESVIANSEIPTILEKNGMDWKKIIQTKTFSLLEQPLPRLCADRIDYTLRDSATFTSEKTRAEIVGNLTQYKGEFAFKTHASALAFVDLYNETNERIWAHPRNGLAYAILAEALKGALDDHTINEDDFRLTDQELLAKMKQSRNPLVQDHLAKLTTSLEAEIDAEKPDYVYRFKVRQIDPLISDGIRVHYLSQIDSTHLARINEAKIHPFKEVPLRIAEA